MALDLERKNGHQRIHRSPDLYIVADYGDSGAYAEVHASFRRAEGELNVRSFRDIVDINVSAFSTLATGFWIRQIGLEGGYPGMVVFSNTAPRGEPKAVAWEGDSRQRLLYGRLSNGVPVFAVSAGHNWSFIKGDLVEFRDLKISNSGSQFRSRDYYPEAVVRTVTGDRSLLGNELDPFFIPDVPPYRIAWRDGYGNIKSTLRLSQLPPTLRESPLVLVTIGTQIGRVARNHLAGNLSEVGQLGLLAGSSGGGDPYLELVKRGGEAVGEFEGVKFNDNTTISLEPYRVYSPAELSHHS